MEAKHAFASIDKPTFDALLSRYPDAVSKFSARLIDLDASRYEEIPSKVRERGQNPYLTQEEVVTLVEWKL